MKKHIGKFIAILLMAALTVGILLIGVFADDINTADDSILVIGGLEPDETRDNMSSRIPTISIGWFEGGGGFVTTELNAWVHRDITYDEVAQAVTTVDGEILRENKGLGLYLIQVPSNTEAGLRNLMDILMSTYPHIFERVGFNQVTTLPTPVQPNEAPSPGGGNDTESGGFRTGSPLGRFEGGGEFITDQLLAFARRGVTYEEVALAVATIDGEILRVSEYVWGLYTIQVPINTEAGLRNLIDILMSTYPHIFYSVGLHGVDGLASPAQSNEAPAPGP